MKLFPLTIPLLAALASTLLLGGCTDPTTGTTQVSGQVVEQHSRRPVGGAAVQVYAAGQGGGYAPVGDPHAADAQGRFAFAFDAAQKGGYLLKAEAPPGYLTDWALAPSLTAGRKNTGLLIPMYAPAWVRLVLVDEAPKSQVMLSINGYSGSGEQLRYPKDTVLIRPILANFKTSISWFIYEAGTADRTSYQYVQPTPLDTAIVRIPF